MKKTCWMMTGKSDPGCVRENNEDNLALDPSSGLMVIADGMGGHSSGEVASRIAVETFIGCGRKIIGVKKGRASGGESSGSLYARQLEHCVQEANRAIFEQSQTTPQNFGMGTTIVAAVIHDDVVSVAHVGDSRFYLFRGGQLKLLTQDHSLVMEQVRKGLISAEQAEGSALQNVLIRALGTEPLVKVDVEDHLITPDDTFLLCTDGLTKMLKEDEIAAVLGNVSDPLDICDVLVDKARAAGGVDNITVIAAKAAERKKVVRGLLNRILKRK